MVHLKPASGPLSFPLNNLQRKSRTDIVSPSLTRIARWLRSWRYEVLERTGQPEANETRFLLFLPPLEAAVALSYLALPSLVLPRLTLSSLLRLVLSYLALSCLVVPANVIIRDHRRGSSSNFVQHLTSFDLSSRQGQTASPMRTLTIL